MHPLAASIIQTGLHLLVRQSSLVVPRLEQDPDHQYATHLRAQSVAATAPRPMPATAHPAPHPGQHTAATNPSMEKPGCPAADESLVIKGHLEGLSKGWGGFGVLRTPDDKHRMERAILGAHLMGDDATAGRLERIYDRVPLVKTPEDAQTLLTELDAVLPAAWELAKRCGSYSVGPELTLRAQKLAQQVADGTLTREQAVQLLREQAQALQSKVGNYPVDTPGGMS